MKISEKTEAKKQKIKKKPVLKPKKEHVLIVAQEIKFARLLAGNEKKTRDRALKTLKKWLLNCFQKGYVFKEDDFLRIWKGLFYAIWMSDKPLVQEELCESIAGILDLFPPEQLQYAILMTKVGLQVLATEWYGIDHHRMDKCLMLVRRYLRGSLRCLRRCNWSLDSCQKYSKMLTAKDGILCNQTPMYARNATSMLMHFVDCFLEELAKVSEGDIQPDSVSELLRPFCQYICTGEADALSTASRRVLTALVRQTDLGLMYQHKTRAWEKMGCPEGGPDAIELVSDDEDQGEEEPDEDYEDGSEKPLDPRAGRVDVLLPTLPVPCSQLVVMLREMLTKCGSKAHKRASICLQRLEKLEASEYPLPIATPPDLPSTKTKPTRAARSLISMEKQLVAASDELALRGLSRKHRKRLLAKSRAGLSIVEDVDAQSNGASSNGENGDWEVEDSEPKSKKKKEDTSNKENVVKEKKKRPKEKQNGVSPKQKHEKKAKVISKKKENKQLKKEAEKKNKHSVSEINNKNTLKVENPKSKDKLTQNPRNTPALIKENSKKELVLKEENPKSKDKLTHNPKNTPALIKENTKKELAKKTDGKKPVTLKTCEIKNKHVPLKTSELKKSPKNPTLTVTKVKQFQKQLSPKCAAKIHTTPKKVKFVLKNNSMQGTVDYYKSIRQSPNIPYDGSKQPSKTNLKPSTPSPINPFFKKKLRMKL